ncbi:MAG: hypothetical protein DMG59_28950 [Acidobacteria bacterium]|nr:MAG: hypothetical protein DMG59_28950 [Acidobacteriota bacterium]
MDPLVGAVKKSKHCNGYAAVKLEELVIVRSAAACAPNYSFLFTDQQAGLRLGPTLTFLMTQRSQSTQFLAGVFADGQQGGRKEAAQKRNGVV